MSLKVRALRSLVLTLLLPLLLWQVGVTGEVLGWLYGAAALLLGLRFLRLCLQLQRAGGEIAIAREVFAHRSPRISMRGRWIKSHWMIARLCRLGRLSFRYRTSAATDARSLCRRLALARKAW